jgi:Escherichia/Staphylococcus phage prohead protease
VPEQPDCVTEYRSVEFVDAELKDRKLYGYAAVFDTPWDERATKLVGYVEELRRGLFRKALPRSGDIPLLWQHDRNQLLARTGSGTMKLEEDGKGLRVEADIPKSGLGEYVREMLGRGDIRGMSYGRVAGRDDQTMEKRNGVWHRIIHDAREITDVCLTWEPTYPGAQVEFRALDFVARPLQEILGGVEAQTEDAATENPPDTNEAVPFSRRLAEIRIRDLEGGFKL